MIDLQEAKQVAIEAAQAAGNLQRERFQTNLNIKTKTSARDLVTEVDTQSQEIIIETIQKMYPTHRFIAEEAGADALGEPDSPFAWIIDPVDGTTNFIHGREEFGVLIALQQDDEIVMGIMLETITGDISSAIKGEGAFHNDQKIHVRNTRDMADAILCTNILKRPKASEIGTMQQITVPICGSLQNYGCALTEMREVALGRNDGVFFNGLGLWDIAPGCIMIREAGGKVRYEPRNPENLKEGYKCVASTETIFEELCDLIW